jgi:hypothetical protein
MALPIEVKTSWHVPVTRQSSWVVRSAIEPVPGAPGTKIFARAKGARHGGQYNIEMTVYVDQSQPEMF